VAIQLESDALPPRAAAIGLLAPALLFTILPVLTGTDGSSGLIAISNARLARAFALQFILSATIGVWLRRLGWRPHRTATHPFVPADLLRGLALWVGLIAAVFCWALICRAAMPGVFAAAVETQVTGLLWLGLGFVAFQRLGIGVAGVLSAGLRLMLHAYQGPLAIVTIVPFAVLFTVSYIQTRRLWPVVVAHAFQDVLSLGLLGWTGEVR